MTVRTDVQLSTCTPKSEVPREDFHAHGRKLTRSQLGSFQEFIQRGAGLTILLDQSPGKRAKRKGASVPGTSGPLPYAVQRPVKLGEARGRTNRKSQFPLERTILRTLQMQPTQEEILVCKWVIQSSQNGN